MNLLNFLVIKFIQMLAIVTDYVNNNTSLSTDSDLGALSVPGQLQVVFNNLLYETYVICCSLT